LNLHKTEDSCNTITNRDNRSEFFKVILYFKNNVKSACFYALDMEKSTQKGKMKGYDTYDLVDARHLRLEDGNGISNRWFLVSNS